MMITQKLKSLTLLTLLLFSLLTLNHLSDTLDAHQAFGALSPQGEVNIEYVGHIGGVTYAVFVQGNYAYIGEGPRLTILDISNPASPTVVGKSELFPDIVRDINVSGSYAYVADGWSGGLRVVDISTPTNPQEVGFFDTPGYAYGVALSGNHAYVADGHRGLRVVDISTPTNPQEVGFFDTPGFAEGVALSGNHAYVADGRGGLRVVDISTPTNPQEVGFFDTPGQAYGVALSGNHAYVADWDGGLRVVDISTPTNPQEVGSYDTPGYAFNVALSGDLAYVAYGDGGLLILRITGTGLATSTPIPTRTPTRTPTNTPAPNTYSISGRVTDGSGTGISGVTVSASGGHSATTDSNGSYTIASLAADSYEIIPDKLGYEFSPVNRSVQVPPNQANIDFVASVDKMTDTDGDAIPDGWEVLGYDVDGDGTPEVDLPAMGAAPLHKDIFVEVDYFVQYEEHCLARRLSGDECIAHTHQPKHEAIAIVVDAFNNAPVDNPDQTTGIHLHVDYGPDAPLRWGSAGTWADLSQADAMPDQDPLQALDTAWDWSGFDQIKIDQGNFYQSRAPIFHYALFVSDLGGGIPIGTSGISRNARCRDDAAFRKGASDFVVALGRYPSWLDNATGDGIGNISQQAGTFMHELGHNLGLRHGGDDCESQEPNYLSVMNYLFQHTGLTKAEQEGYFDYSRFDDIPPLDESSLDETIGLNDDSINAYGTRYECWMTDPNPVWLNRYVTNANGRIDWNCNFLNNQKNVEADINGDGQINTSPLTGNFNDWFNLVYDGGSVGGGSDMEGLESPTRAQLGDPIDEEMTYEMYQRLYRPYDIALSADTDMVVLPGTTSVISVTLTNLGALTATVSLDTELDNGWFDLSALPTSITINPSTTLSFPVILTVPSGATDGEVQATITAVVQESTIIFDSTILKVHVGPLAWFTTESTNQPAPYTLVFTDISIGNVTSWSWDFGDSTTSTLQNPTHTYAAQGNYTVSLTVSGPDGSDTLTRTYFVGTIETEQSELYLPLITR